MIPQRNLSVLANRLAKEGGRRIPESVLERDYCLAWFLAVLAESDLKATLGFKGGTALKRCYFGVYRFSKNHSAVCGRSSSFCARRAGAINRGGPDIRNVE